MTNKTASPHASLADYYNGALSNSPVDVYPASAGNIYGFLFDNNSSSSDVFIQIFDKAAANVTLGTTVPDKTYRVPAGALFGKDALDLVLHHFQTGCSIACTATRTGSGAPAAAATVHMWTWNSN